MGPPIFVGGDTQRRQATASSLYVASMGPPIFVDGDEQQLVALRQWRDASMGPPIFVGGDTRSASSIVYSSACFNGATDLRRWRRVLVGVRGQLVLALQWGHRSSSVETFRGAADRCRAATASMGPPIFVGGDGVSRPGHRSRWRSASMGRPIFVGGDP